MPTMTDIPPQAKYYKTKQRKQTSHTFHLVMTILTGGAWALFIWLPLTMWHKMGPKKTVKTKIQY